MTDWFGLLDEAILWILRTIIGGAMLAGLAALFHSLAWRGQIHPDDKNKPAYRQRVMTGHWRPGYAVRWGTWLGVLVTLGPAIALIVYSALT